MKQKLGPTWTKKQREEGEKMHRAWEVFFSTADKGQVLAETDHVSGLVTGGRISDILARHETNLLKFRNVIGVSEGIRTKRGRPTGEPCVTILVRQKIPNNLLAKNDILPKEIEDVPVDVVEVGEIVAL